MKKYTPTSPNTQLKQRADIFNACPPTVVTTEDQRKRHNLCVFGRCRLKRCQALLFASVRVVLYSTECSNLRIQSRLLSSYSIFAKKKSPNLLPPCPILEKLNFILKRTPTIAEFVLNQSGRRNTAECTHH